MAALLSIEQYYKLAWHLTYRELAECIGLSAYRNIHARVIAFNG